MLGCWLRVGGGVTFARGRRPPGSRCALKQGILNGFKHQRSEHRAEPSPVVVHGRTPEEQESARLVELPLHEEVVVERDHFLAPGALGSLRRCGAGSFCFSACIGRGRRRRLFGGGEARRPHRSQEARQCQEPRRPAAPTLAVEETGPARDHRSVIQRSEGKVPSACASVLAAGSAPWDRPSLHADQERGAGEGRSAGERSQGGLRPARGASPWAGRASGRRA